MSYGSAALLLRYSTFCLRAKKIIIISVLADIQSSRAASAMEAAGGFFDGVFSGTQYRQAAEFAIETAAAKNISSITRTSRSMPP
jgi:hypothetical protein